MKKIKMMTIVGTRPELIRLSEIIKKADLYFDHLFIHTGQNYDERLNTIFYEDLGLRNPDHYLNVVGSHLGETMGNTIAKAYEIMQIHQPDAVLILGDTNSSLSAIAAKRLKIPIFHMEAGNRCFDENLPEEINRRIVDHISDVNLPYTEHARRYLLEEGVRKDFIFVTGSPMREVLTVQMQKIQESRILNQLDLSEKGYFLLSAHREENIDHPAHFINLMEAVNQLAQTYQVPVIYSVHPRSAKLIEQRQFIFHPVVRKMRPFSFSDYNALQMHARCVVSDSGTLPEEAAILRFPAVSIRTSTERPEALERGCFILGGITGEDILRSVEMADTYFSQTRNYEKVEDYEKKNVSDLVVGLIESYTHVVNRRIWGK